MNRKTATRLTAVGLAFIVPFAGAQAANAAETDRSQITSATDLTQEDIREINSFLDYVDTIPDDVVAKGSDEEIAAYLQRGTAPRNAFECAGAITLIVAGTVLPIAKVVSIVRAVKALGGASRVGRLIEEAGGLRNIIATKGASIEATEVRDQLLSLASELSGIGLAIEKC
ncbi:hypothetical protein [Corynebacterium heidelbergense]|uniref:Secreted protein n=1 Tax=Corynebacterium heidelbergense TaxID=2055947 RepID=A0A364V9A8_9CORY|nr:hypothetical protein [Corynebacterium heidelbergense]RAV33211.1 hypothetical protein CWC39_09705 [Corynebacterium heidelbergense]WCZ36989.1 hypothetical protein CHEID_07280 [Corynebacterium heidelbergense]